MEFSILVTSFNDEKNFKAFFENIESQTVKPYEVVIADGGSSDSSEAVVDALAKQFGYPIRFVSTDKRLNIAEGYNVAIRECKTELMIMMGIGNCYKSNFCESILHCYEKHKVDIVYTPIVGIDKTKFARAFNIAFVGGRKGKDFGYASNRGALLSKSVFKKIGYFYENFVYAGEDTEFFIRAEKCGLKSEYDTNTVLYWETPATFKEYLKKNSVNAIADMQCQTNVALWRHILIRLAIILCFVSSGFVKWYAPLIIVAILLALIICKIKSFNVMAILLRFHFIFLPSYYYIKNKKYFAKNYKVKL